MGVGWRKKKHSPTCSWGFLPGSPVLRMPEAQHYIKDRTTGCRCLAFPERTSFPTASTQALKGPKDERRGLRRSRVTGEDRAPDLGGLGEEVREEEQQERGEKG